MADSTVSSLTELTTPATGDLIPIVDVSDTTMASSGTTKKITSANLLTSKLDVTSKATAAEVATGTDDTKYTTPLAVAPYANQSLFRQAIINGNFDVWQRGTSFTTGGIYTADRWALPGAPGQAAERSTDTPDGSSYSIQITNTSGAQWTTTRIESINAKKLAGKTVTLSIYMKQVSGDTNCSMDLAYANTADNFSAQTSIGSTTFTPTTSWVKYTYTVALPANAANGIQVRIVTGIDASVKLLSQVQLCAGSVALPFQPKSFAEELRDCQRYYEKSYDYATAPGTSTANGAVYVDSNGGSYCILGNVRYKVEKRIAITPTTYSQTGAVGKIRNVTAGSDLTAAITGGGANGFSIFVNNQASTALDDLSAHWTADAEL
jgi:hypothetical protein